MGWGKSEFTCQGVCAPVILVLRECIWNALAVSLVLPAFDDTDSLGSPPRQVVYQPNRMVPPWVTTPVSLRGIRTLS